jgi:hypothetical protein
MAVCFRVVGTLAAVATLGLSGCGSDLGECDEVALAAANPTGQSVIGGSCASSRCHSELAFGDARIGAPADLDFDVNSAVPAVRERSLATVRDEVDDIWSEIDGETMPPAAPAGAPLTADQKEAVRNWLACGAPDTSGPAPTDEWSAILGVLDTNCNGCHGAAFMGAGDGFNLGSDPCTAWRNIVNVPAVTMSGMCSASGLTLVVPGDPDSSLLLQKVESATPACGSPMPFGSVFANTDPATVARLRTWIAAGAQPPTGCTP